MKAEWREYFSFSRSQRRFIAFFAFVLILIITANFFSDSLYKPKALDFTVEKELFAKLNEQNTKITEQTIKRELFEFNPNKLDRESWQKLGLNDWQINMIYNFEAKFGKFKTKADFAKLYCISEEEFAQFEAYILLPEKTDKSEITKAIQKEEISYFHFNPNTLPFEDMAKLGISKKTAYNISRFREKGGTFTKKEDLLKIYSFDTALYKNLEEYIVIETAEKIESNAEINSKNIVVELNSTDSINLIKVNEIGPFRAKMILEYRKKLGGYYSINQLKEVYGITEEVLYKLKPQLKIDSNEIIKINLNTCSFKELLAHPYTEYYHVQELMKYRDEKGKFTELPNPRTFLFEFSFFEKMLPYLSIE